MSSNLILRAITVDSMKITQKQLGYISHYLLKDRVDDFPDDSDPGVDYRLQNAEKWCKKNLDKWEASNIIDLVENGHRGKAMELIVRLGLPVKE